MKKRILAWIAALVLLVTMLPISAMAIDVTLPPSGDVAPVTHSVRVTAAAPLMAANSATYESDEQVLAATLRQALLERRRTVTLYCQVPADTDIRAYTKSLMELAKQETGNGSEGDYLRWQTGGWNCSMSYIPVGDTWKMTITYTISYYTTVEQEQEVTRRVNSIIESFGFDDSTTDYQKVRTVYEYIAARMTYDYAHLSDPDYKLQYTAYAALVNGTSVCQGYANLLYRILNDCGVPCRIITGIGVTSEGAGGHAWNLVKLGDEWYNVDLTWDDAYQDKNIPMRPYFLRGSWNFDGDHYRDDEYATSAFHSVYPTSLDDYVPTDCDQGAHRWSDWTVDVMPTYTQPGHQYSVCGACGVKREESVPTLTPPAVTVADLTMVLRHVAGIETIEDEDILLGFDYDGSGCVDAADVTVMAGLLSK